jgi:hypothetical protein
MSTLVDHRRQVRLNETDRTLQQRTKAGRLHRGRSASKEEGVVPVDDDAIQRDFIELGVGVTEVLLISTLETEKMIKFGSSQSENAVDN